MPIHRFTPHISQDALDDLQARLRSVRWPASLEAESWEDGASLSFMNGLVDYWLHRFDWRAQEDRLSRLPHAMTTIDGADIHFIHERGRGPSPLPLVLTHGWPGSFIEFEQILPLLTDPAANGGDAADAFHVVVPSLPGFGFSPAPRTAGVSSKQIAALWHSLMVELGYPWFAAQGGDIGSGVSIWLARQFPGSVVGIHLNFISSSYRPPLTADSPPIAPEEQAYLDRVAAWAAAEGAYAAVHSTKPQTLAYSLTDSPVGLAAWIVEKMRSWSDCHGDVESVFSLDTMLTDISLYWFGHSLQASLRLYKENRLNPLVFSAGERVIPPLGMSHFPCELPTPPRSWLERVFDVRRWTSMPRGGHFAALEQPGPSGGGDQSVLPAIAPGIATYPWLAIGSPRRSSNDNFSFHGIGNETLFVRQMMQMVHLFSGWAL